MREAACRGARSMEDRVRDQAARGAQLCFTGRGSARDGVAAPACHCARAGRSPTSAQLLGALCMRRMVYSPGNRSYAGGTAGRIDGQTQEAFTSIITVEAGPILASVPTPSHGEEVPLMDQQSETQWNTLWHRIEAQGDPYPPYHDLVQRLAEPHRAYHTMRHIRHCLAEMACVRHLAAHPDAVEMALWYHDAIYDTHATDNEAQSATLAAHRLRDASVPEAFVQLVGSLIMATQHHAVADDPDTRLLIDIDLAILGQSALIFDAYERHIRQEYAWVPHDAFLEGRTKILRAFLHRSTLYATAHFRQCYEAQARINIARSLRALEQQA